MAEGIVQFPAALTVRMVDDLARGPDAEHVAIQGVLSGESLVITGHRHVETSAGEPRFSLDQ